VTVLLAIVAGIVLDRYGSPVGQTTSPWAWMIGAAIAVGGWWVAWRRSGAPTTRARAWAAACLLLASVSLTSAAWHDLGWNRFPQLEIARYAQDSAGPACVEVIALESPDVIPAPRPTALRAIALGERSRLDVRAAAIRDGTAWRPASGNCQLSVDGRVTDVRAGDRLRVFGRLSRVDSPRNPGEFDFSAYARSERRLVQLASATPAAMTRIAPAAGWQPRRLLESARDAGQSLVARCVGPERAPLASANLLGAREGLTREETASYLVTGTIHLLVVSGMNVAILAVGLHLGARWGWLGRRLGLVLVMLLVTAYALMAGAEPPVIRAAVLAVLWCVAEWTGRRRMGYNALAAAAIAVLALNPADLFRPGPQLSFLAVAALIWIGEGSRRWASPGDRLDQMIAASRPWPMRAARQLVTWNAWLIWTTLVVWLTAVPLVLHHFHVLTPVTVLISPVVWAVVFVALWSGFLMLLFGWMWSPVGMLLGSVCDSSLAGLERIVVWAEEVPGGHYWAPGPAGWWVLGFYVGLIAVMLWRGAMPRMRWQFAALCAWIVMGCTPPIVRGLTRDRLDVAFVSVGHGTCVVLQGPSGETLLYDAGSLGSPDSATRTVASYLWNRGVLRIDGIVLSHADVDHYNGVPGLLERFKVGAIYVSPVMFDGIGIVDLGDGARTTAEVETLLANVRRGPAELRAAIDRAGVPIREIWAGDRLRLGSQVEIKVLHPARRGVIGSDNANSLTLSVNYRGRSVLLPGDLESPGLEDVTAELPHDCDVLLAPHHGSRRSDPPGFAAWSTPEWVIVSCGEVDVRPAVRSYELAGARVFQTNRHGTIEFQLGQGPIQAATWKPYIR
jgi:competence protein ComEC